MIEFDICGIGAWSEHFSNAEELLVGIEGGAWQESTTLQPELIPPRERRRAPQFVKMAVEVMLQACQMAEIEPSQPAAVFASQMSDMDTTDSICDVLAKSPSLVSPTRFHNSVHNAAVGYWSIGAGNTAPANAIAALDWSAPIALFEAAAQVATEKCPVLVVAQDSTPPTAFDYICHGAQSFAAALLLAPLGSTRGALANCTLAIRGSAVAWPELPPGLPPGLKANASARLLPLLAVASRPPQYPTPLSFPLGMQQSLHLEVQAAVSS